MAANTDLKDDPPASGNQVAGTQSEEDAGVAASHNGQNSPSANEKSAKGETSEDPAQSANLETVLRRVVEHIGSTDRHHSEALNDLRERIVSLGQQTEAARQGQPNLSSDELNKIDDHVKHLSECVESAEQARSATDARQVLEERIAGLADQKSENAAPETGHEQKNQTAENESHAAIAELAEDLNADITFTVTDGPDSEFEVPLGKEVGAEQTTRQQNDEPDSDDTDKQALKTLADVYDSQFRPADDGQKLEETAAAADKVKAQAATDSASISLAITPSDQRTETIKGTRRRSKAKGDRFAQIAGALEDTMQQKKTAQAERHSVRACFDELTTRVEAMLRSRAKDFSLEPIENQVAEISAYVAKTEQHFGKITTIETKLLQLIEMVESGQSNLAEATSKGIDAAATRIEETVNKATQAKRLQAIQKSIESLAEKGRTTEVQTVDTLEAINKTLSNMVDRLQSVEATGIATKAELRAIRQSASSTPTGQAGKKKLLIPTPKAGKAKSKKPPIEIEVAKPAAPAPNMPASEPASDKRQEDANAEANPVPEAKVNTPASSPQTKSSEPISEGQESKNEPKKETNSETNSQGEVFPSHSTSRKEDFISAARRAALQDTPSCDQMAPTSEENGDLAPLRTLRQMQATSTSSIKNRLGSLVRSLPRPPFVVLAIAAFTASAGILTTGRLLDTFATEESSVKNTVRPGNTVISPVKDGGPAKGAFNKRQHAQRKSADQIPKQAIDATKSPAETRMQASEPKPARLAAANPVANWNSETIGNEFRVLTVPKRFLVLPNAEIANSTAKGIIVTKPPVEDRIFLGRNAIKSVSDTTASLRPNRDKPVADRTAVKPRKAKPPRIAKAKESNRAPAARPDPKPKLSLPPTTIGSLALRRAAANGNMTAQYEVALRFAQGKGVKQDYVKTATWFKRAASRGFAPAEYRVATLFERGLGVSKDLGLAQFWYNRAAQNGNVKAMHNLAVLHVKSANGTADYTQAAKWFRKAAAYGLADSQYNLGLLYETGLGLKKNLSKSYKWFSLAAARGDNEARIRRDKLRGQLADNSRKLAQLEAENWRAKSIKRAANVVTVPIDGWLSGPNGRNLISTAESPKLIASNKS